MRFLRVFLGTLLLLGACSSSSSDEGDAVDVTIDTFNVALAGRFIPYEAERRQPLADAIAEVDSDIVCLQEVWTQADKELIRDMAVGNFPYSVLFETALDTPVNDDTDQMGEVPPTPTTVPCPDTEAPEGGVTIADQMTTAVDCVVEFCSTDDGYTESTSCAGKNCTLDVLPLLNGDAQQQRCYACIATQLPTSKLADIGTNCTTVVDQDLAFEGQNGVMILSRYPLSNAENWVIPGTWNQRVIIRATATLPNEATLDMYCNHLTPIFDDLTYPYTGQYGNDNLGAAGWESEQYLQAQKLIAFVQDRSGDSPAVILGDLNAGRAYPAQDISEEGADTLSLLEATFPAALASDYEPLCTFCADNPLTDTASSVWIDHILLNGLTSDATQSTVRTFDDAVVPVGGDELVPLSDHYGLRSVIRVP
jgi:endonuclease/exonuclease/phosphatase family metal-dependent hydrolase